MDIKKDQPFEFKATYEVYPTIEIKDLSGAKIDRESAEVVDGDMDNMLAKIQKHN